MGIDTFYSRKSEGALSDVTWNRSLSLELKEELQAFVKFLLEWDVKISTQISHDASTLKEVVLQAGTFDEDDLAQLCLNRNWSHLKEAWEVELSLPQRQKTR
jgi:hypothetical protein